MTLALPQADTFARFATARGIMTSTGPASPIVTGRAAALHDLQVTCGLAIQLIPA